MAARTLRNPNKVILGTIQNASKTIVTQRVECFQKNAGSNETRSYDPLKKLLILFFEHFLYSLDEFFFHIFTLT